MPVQDVAEMRQWHSAWLTLGMAYHKVSWTIPFTELYTRLQAFVSEKWAALGTANRKFSFANAKLLKQLAEVNSNF